jgi:hypothetical protein
MVNNTTGDHLAQSSADTDRSGYPPNERLNLPVPRVRSAITSTDTTPKIPAPMPSIVWIATSNAVLDVSV